MAFKKHSRWTHRVLAALPGWGLAGVLGTAAVAGVAGSSALGQDVSAETTVNRTYINKPLVHLPIEIDAGQRTQIASLVLYAKEGANGAWSIRDKAAPMQTSFTFRAPQDGEYWFRIVAIDNQGKAHPDDLAKEPQDAVVVVVDQAPPVLDVTYQGNFVEGQVVQCDMRDANPDVFKMRFFYQTRDQVWRTLDSVPNQPNTFLVPAQAALTNFIRVVAVDLAGNSTARTLNLSELAVAPKTGARTNPGQTAASNPTANAPAPNIVAANPLPVNPSPASPFPAAPATLPQSLEQQPILPNNSPKTISSQTGILQTAAPQPGPIIIDHLPVEPRTPQPQPINPSRPVAKSASTPPVANNGPTLEIPPVAKVPEAVLPDITTTSGTLSKQTTNTTSNLQIVGAPRVFLNYAVENVGASGVGKMEIYATADRGQTWLKLAEETERRNPAEVTLPGEGLFGLKLVASNGRGYGAQPPQAGDPADSWIEVDTTKPRVTITGVRPGMGSEAGLLTILWQAEDKNLANDGVEIYYATHREGPWAPIGKNLKNSGEHRWLPPRDAGAQAFIRLVARDKAGNVGLSETTQPVQLDDLSRPRIRVLGVSVSAAATLSSEAGGPIQRVQTTNTPLESSRAEPSRVQPANHTTSGLGVEVR